MISALNGSGCKDLVKWLAEALPEGPWYYPEDEISDMPMRNLAAEITREKIYDRLHQELPYHSHVETEKWEEMKNGDVRIQQVITPMPPATVSSRRRSISVIIRSPRRRGGKVRRLAGRFQARRVSRAPAAVRCSRRNRPPTVTCRKSVAGQGRRRRSDAERIVPTARCQRSGPARLVVAREAGSRCRAGVCHAFG